MHNHWSCHIFVSGKEIEGIPNVGAILTENVSFETVNVGDEVQLNVQVTIDQALHKENLSSRRLFGTELVRGRGRKAYKNGIFKGTVMEKQADRYYTGLTIKWNAQENGGPGGDGSLSLFGSQYFDASNPKRIKPKFDDIQIEELEGIANGGGRAINFGENITKKMKKQQKL